MKLTRADSGRKGGMTTLRRYGREQLAYWGKYGNGGNPGGRPRNPTYDEISRQRRLLEQNNNNKEVIPGPPGSLTELKRLHKLRSRSNSPPETEQAGIAQETPQDFGYKLLATNLKPSKSLPERKAVR